MGLAPLRQGISYSFRDRHQRNADRRHFHKTLVFRTRPAPELLMHRIASVGKPLSHACPVQHIRTAQRSGHGSPERAGKAFQFRRCPIEYGSARRELQTRAARTLKGLIGWIKARRASNISSLPAIGRPDERKAQKLFRQEAGCPQQIARHDLPSDRGEHQSQKHRHDGRKPLQKKSANPTMRHPDLGNGKLLVHHQSFPKSARTEDIIRFPLCGDVRTQRPVAEKSASIIGRLAASPRALSYMGETAAMKGARSVWVTVTPSFATA